MTTNRKVFKWPHLFFLCFLITQVLKLRCNLLFWLFDKLKVVFSKKKKQFCVACTADKFLLSHLFYSAPSSAAKGQKAHNVFTINFGISEERASLSLQITSLNKYPQIHISPMALADTIFIFKKTKQNITTIRLYYLLAWVASVKKKKKEEKSSIHSRRSWKRFSLWAISQHRS